MIGPMIAICMCHVSTKTIVTKLVPTIYHAATAYTLTIITQGVELVLDERVQRQVLRHRPRLHGALGLAEGLVVREHQHVRRTAAAAAALLVHEAREARLAAGAAGLLRAGIGLVPDLAAGPARPLLSRDWPFRAVLCGVPCGAAVDALPPG